MSTESPTKDTRAQPEASVSTIGNHENKDTAEPMISTASTGGFAPTSTSTSMSGNVYVYNVYNQESKLETLVHSRVPLEIKAWLQDLSKETGDTVSQIIRKILVAAYRGQKAAPAPQHYNPTIILNYNVAKAESNPINVGDFVAEKQLDTIISKVRSLKSLQERAEKEGNDNPPTFAVSRSKELEEDILRVLKGVKKISPAKLEEVNAALTILRSIRGGA